MLNYSPGLEPRHLATLSAVGQEGSFKGAAKRLGYVQSAVSQQIAQLERQVGQPLVERSRGQIPLTLTEAGTALSAYADGIVAQLDAAAADLRAITMPRAELRVGAADRGATKVLLRALTALARTNPSLRLIVCDEGSSSDHQAAIRRGAMDAAFAELPLEPGPFGVVEVLRDPVVLVVPRDCPLAARLTVPTLEDLASLPLMPDTSRRMTGLLEARLRSAGLDPRFVNDSDLTTSVQALVGAGLGAALMPRLAVEASDPLVAVLNLGDLFPPRRLALYWHDGRRRVAGLDALRDAALRAGAELEPPPAGDCSGELAVAA